MAQRLNKKLVVGLTIAGMAVIAGAGVLLVYAMPGRDPKPMADQAAKLAKQEDFETASQYYVKAANRAMNAGKPDQSNEYMVLAGEVALQGGDQRTAVGCWRRVLRQDPQHEVAQQKLVELAFEQAELYGQRWWQEVRNEAERLCDISENENLVGLHALACSLIEPDSATDEDLAKGEELLTTALQRDPTNPEFARSLAEYHLEAYDHAVAEARRKGEDVGRVEAGRDEAIARATGVYDALLEALEKSPPDDPAVLAKAWRERARLYLRIRDRLEREYRGRQAQLTPTQREVHQKRIEEYMQQALGFLENALHANENDAETLVLMGSFWRAKNSTAADPAERQAEIDGYRAKAQQYFEKAIEADPDSFDGYVQLQAIYLREAEVAAAQRDRETMVENFRKADQVLQERVKRGVPKSGVSLWRDRAMMALVRWQLFELNALQIERLRALGGDNLENEIKGLYERLTGIRADMVADVPNGEKDPRCMFMKARLEMLDNRVYDAVATFRELQNLLDSGELWLRTKLYLAELCLGIEEPRPAIDALQSVVKVYPQIESANALLARAYASLPEHEAQAEAAARQTLNINPDNREALVALARVYEKQKKWRELEEVHARLMQNQQATQSLLQEANLLLAQATDPENPDANLAAKAQGMLRQVLAEDPSNWQALRLLVSTLAVDDSRREELQELVSKARDALDEQLAELRAATQPAENEVKQAQKARSIVDVLALSLSPDLSREERIKQTEEIVRQNNDPFAVAIDLYRLLITVDGRQAEAIEHLKDAYRLKPDDKAVVEMLFRTSIAKIKDEQGNVVVPPDWELAEKLVERGTDLGLDRSGGHYLRGQLLYANTDLPDNYVQAEREFREGLEVFPLHSNGYAWLGRSLLAQKRGEEARQAFLEAYRQNPRNGMAAMYLAMLADGRRDQQEKVRYLSVCRDLNVRNEWVNQQLQILDDLKSPAEGIARREAKRKADPDDRENLIQLANLYERDNQPEKVKEVLAECHALQPKNVEFLARYAAFLRDLNPPAYAEAEAVIRKTMEALGEDEEHRRATAQLLLAAHMETLRARGVEDAPSDEAVQQAYTAAAEISDSAPVLLDIANHYLRQRDTSNAEAWVRRAIASAERAGETNSERQARAMLLELLLNGGDVERSDEILKEIQIFKTKFNLPSASLALSEHATMMGRETAAIDYASDYIAAATGMNKALGYYRRGAMYYRRGDWDLAIKDLREAKALTSDAFDFQHRILLARALQVTGQTDQAVTELTSILEEDRTALVAANELFQIYMASKQYDEAEAFILPAYQQDPKSPTWIGLLAEVAAARGDYNRAVERAAETVVNSGHTPAMMDKLLTIYLEYKRYDEMLAYINNVLPAEKRDNFLVNSRLAMLYLARGDQAKASELYGKAIESVPGGLVGAFQRIVVSMPKLVGREATMQFISAEAARHPDNALAQLVLAQLHRQAGDVDKFLEIAEPLAAKLRDAGEEQAAIRIEVTQNIADVLHKEKRYEEARKYYDEVLTVAPPKSQARAITLNNVAYMLIENANDPVTGLKYAEQAAELISNQTNVLDTLGWGLIKTGKYDRGIAAVRAGIRTASAMELNQMAAVHFHAAYGLAKRAEQLKSQNRGTEAEQDIAEAKLSCRRAHGLLMMARRDEDGLLPKIVELGNQLGLTLEAEMPEATAGAN